jgi:alanine dehydrogenase
MIVKVKEPQPQEIALLEPRHLLFTYLHLAADKPQAEGLMKSGATCIAYETVTARSGALPLLKPMSEVAGRMSVQVGAHYLEKEQGGRGVLLGGVPGVAPAKVAILGGGVSGVNAAQMAVGMRADVTIYDISNERLAELDMFFGSQIKTAYASGAIAGGAGSRAGDRRGAGARRRAPKLVTRDMLKTMKRGSVLVDIAIDQGGCFETSHATTHDRPGLRGRRRDPLLRRQHAGRGRAHQRLRAQQRDPALRAEARQPGRRSGDERPIRTSPTASTCRAARSGTRRSPKRSTCKFRRAGERELRAWR